MARSLVLTHLHHSWCLWNHKYRWVWALLGEFLKDCLAKYKGFFLNKDGDCSLAFCLPLRCCLSFSQFSFLRRASWLQRFFPVAIKIKDEDDFCFLWEYSANTVKNRIVLTTCHGTCHLFLCFTHLLGCSLMCSDTSALTLQLTDPAPLSYWTKKGQFSQALSAQRKMSLD